MANRKIRQEINFHDYHAIYGDGRTSVGIAKFIPSNYSNISAIYFEIVALGGNNIGLYKRSNAVLSYNGATSVVYITPSSSSVFARYRSADIKSSFTNDSNPFLVASYAIAGIEIKSARLIIIQDAEEITDTQTQIEVGAYQSTASAAAANTYYALSEPKYWKYEASKWDPTPTFTLGFTAKCEDDMDQITVALQESTDAAFTSPSTVTNTPTSFTSETVTYYESSAFTPTDGYYYRLVWQTNDTMTGCDIFNAKMIATSTHATAISKIQPEYLLINESQTDTGLQEYQTYYDPAEWDDGAGGKPTFYHEHSTSSASSNTVLMAIEEYEIETAPSYQRSMYSGQCIKAAQSFNAISSGKLRTCQVYLKKFGNPTGNATAVLYAHSGTFGTSSVPTGSALATSDTFDVSTLTTSFAVVEFNFSSPYTLTADTKYCISIEYSGGNGSNFIYLGYNGSSPTHEGNYAEYTSSWSYNASNDVHFKVSMEITNSDITGDDLTRGGSALTMPSTAKEIDAYIVTA